jgi:hypothetical protein
MKLNRFGFVLLTLCAFLGNNDAGCISYQDYLCTCRFPSSIDTNGDIVGGQALAIDTIKNATSPYWATERMIRKYTLECTTNGVESLPTAKIPHVDCTPL